MPVEDQRETRGYRVTGRVQGVGFRWWTVGVAENLQLGGSVRNLPDGSVEVRAVGRVSDLDRLEAELRAGPRFSVVEGLERFQVEVGLRADVFRIEH